MCELLYRVQNTKKSPQKLNIKHNLETILKKKKKEKKGRNPYYAEVTSITAERGRVLTMKYGKHQMKLIKKRMNIENWIDAKLNQLYDGKAVKEIDYG
ncbi:unnamed protein product [Dracunculus medinensis]|uniref:Tox-REase-7 domain-containing protein n=1 Tax=Dracunculus medinensis TaxID=318479 RepID=A0A158Q2H3_DRAME|nr:unnamed protein product [Dracunculus medinensis]